MSVLIHGMEMPKSCRACLFSRTDIRNVDWCVLTEKDLPCDCPIVPVPKHSGAQEEMLKHKIETNYVTLNGRKYGRLIENCPPNMKPTIFGMAVKADYALPDDYDFLVQYEPPQPMTNADRIRGMTDEELAHFIAGQRGWYCDFKDPSEEEYPKVLDWLKAPVEVEGK